MELKQIKELMASMERWGTTKLHIKKGEFELELQRGSNTQAAPSRYPDLDTDFEEGRPQFRNVARPSNAPLPKAEAAMHQEPPPAQAPGIFITSPMVGTFYSTPSPDDPPYVKVGDTVEKGTVVCVIEAMKVMNEIKSQVSGVVAEVLIENGHPVEFGTKLFRIQ